MIGRFKGAEGGRAAGSRRQPPAAGARLPSLNRRLAPGTPRLVLLVDVLDALQVAHRADVGQQAGALAVPARQAAAQQGGGRRAARRATSGEAQRWEPCGLRRGAAARGSRPQQQGRRGQLWAGSMALRRATRIAPGGRRRAELVDRPAGRRRGRRAPIRLPQRAWPGSPGCCWAAGPPGGASKSAGSWGGEKLAASPVLPARAPLALARVGHRAHPQLTGVCAEAWGGGQRAGGRSSHGPSDGDPTVACPEPPAPPAPHQRPPCTGRTCPWPSRPRTRSAVKGGERRRRSAALGCPCRRPTRRPGRPWRRKRGAHRVGGHGCELLLSDDRRPATVCTAAWGLGCLGRGLGERGGARRDVNGGWEASRGGLVNMARPHEDGWRRHARWRANGWLPRAMARPTIHWPAPALLSCSRHLAPMDLGSRQGYREAAWPGACSGNKRRRGRM